MKNSWNNPASQCKQLVWPSLLVFLLRLMFDTTKKWIWVFFRKVLCVIWSLYFSVCMCIYIYRCVCVCVCVLWNTTTRQSHFTIAGNEIFSWHQGKEHFECSLPLSLLWSRWSQWLWIPSVILTHYLWVVCILISFSPSQFLSFIPYSIFFHSGQNWSNIITFMGMKQIRSGFILEVIQLNFFLANPKVSIST